ncbi:thioredoxin-dependent thiol peroxidase [bacterium]|jgi:peroxiredoxin Q/BCP|nr:thioredoxin-dependent thiol peroxidase [bacterium]
MAKKKAAKKKTPIKKLGVKKKSAKKGHARKKTALKKTTAEKGTRKAVSLSKVSLLAAGQKAPWAPVIDENGAPVNLDSFAGKTVVLYFYPKDDTPGCTQESCDFRDHFGRLQGDDVVVLGVSKDSPSSHVRFKAKYQLPFTLISDEGGDLCEAYGVWKEKSMYGRNYMGIERSTFVIDSLGRIAKVYPKVSVTGHVEQILQDLRDLKG